MALRLIHVRQKLVLYTKKWNLSIIVFTYVHYSSHKNISKSGLLRLSIMICISHFLYVQSEMRE